jgi:hypothetical protein
VSFSKEQEEEIFAMAEEISNDFDGLFKELVTEYEGDDDFTKSVAAVHLGFMNAFVNATGFVLASGMLTSDSLDEYLKEIREGAHTVSGQLINESKILPTPAGDVH